MEVQSSEVTDTGSPCQTELKKRDEELRSNRNDIFRLEETVREQADMIDELKSELRSKRTSDDNALLSTSDRISEQQSRVLHFTISQLRDELAEAKQHSASARAIMETQKTLCLNQEKEITKRREQLEESLAVVEQMRSEVREANKRANGTDWRAKERVMRMEMEEERVINARKIISLQTKLKLMREREDSMFEELDSARTKLDECRAQYEAHLNECTTNASKLSDKEAELISLRTRVEVYGSVRGTGRSESTEDMLVAQVRALTAQIDGMQNARGDERLSNLENRVGSLSATNEFLDKQLKEAKEREERLNEEIEKGKEEVKAVKEDVKSAEARLLECEGSADRTNRYLADENGRIKRQKAEIRCELAALKREHAKLVGSDHKANDETQVASLVKQVDDLTTRLQEAEQATNTANDDKKSRCEMHKGDCVSVSTEQTDMTNCERCERLNDELTTLKQTISTLEQKSKELNDECTLHKAVSEKMHKDVLTTRENNEQLQSAMRVVDQQCDKLMELKKRAEAGRKRAMEQLTSLNSKLEIVRKESDKHQQTDADHQRLIVERNRLSKKVDYLTEELRETHTDYRAELSKLARQMSESKKKDASENESFAAKIEALQAEKRQAETRARSLERQLEQYKSECGSHARETGDVRDSQSKVIEENTKLRDGLAMAIGKAERFKEEIEALKEDNLSLVREVARVKDEKSDAVIRAESFQQAVAEKERLVAYLQSQLHLRGTGKLNTASSHSTLISEGSFTDTVTSENDDLNSSPIGKRRVTETRSNRSVVRNADSYVNTPSTPRPLTTSVSQSGNAPSTPSRICTMKHDIPHRWKSFMVLKQAKCIACYEGLPRVRHALKCTECGLMAHRICTNKVANTCGLPEQCADYYLDSCSGSTHSMSGWVKTLRCEDAAGNKWRSAWASISDHRLRLFDNDNAPIKGEAPFHLIDLEADHWRLHMQSVLESGVKDNVSKQSLALLIELRLARGSLYMLAPTVKAKERWVRALQSATDRRMFVQRQPSSGANKMLIALDAPLNLTINCSQMLGDWLLIGAQEGLFVTQLSSPRVPFVVAGLAAVFQMELLSELDMLIAISGLQRHLVLMHISDLSEGLKADRPTVRPTAISGLSACHLLTVHVDRSNNTRYLVVADPDKVHLLQYNARLGIFTPYKSVATCEPATCLVSTCDGVVFGADQFYLVNTISGTARPVVVPGCPSDFPLAAVALSDREMLLAFHNFGVFCDMSGNRTRPENVDWSRAPLEFVYVCPTLYVVHNDTLEILQVAEYEGPNSRCLLDARDFYRCHCAHFIGKGKMSNEVLFALTGNDRSEIHSFCGSVERKTWIFEYSTSERSDEPATKKMRPNEEIPNPQTEDDESRGNAWPRKASKVLMLHGSENLV